MRNQCPHGKPVFPHFLYAHQLPIQGFKKHFFILIIRPLREQFIRAKYERKEYCNNNSTSSKEEEVSTSNTKEGYLTKKGEVVKNWKKRWFTLNGSILSYYKKPTDNVPAGTIIIQLSKTIDCLNEPIDNKPNTFVVKLPTRDYYIQADNTKLMYDWVQVLRANLNRLSPNYSSNDGKYKTSNDIAVQDIISKLSSSLNILKRKHSNGKTYPNCFIGAACVDYLISNLNLTTRQEAVKVGQKLLDEGFISALTSDKFEDDNHFYQFLKTQ